MPSFFYHPLSVHVTFVPLIVSSICSKHPCDTLSIHCTVHRVGNRGRTICPLSSKFKSYPSWEICKFLFLRNCISMESLSLGWEWVLGVWVGSRKPWNTFCRSASTILLPAMGRTPWRPSALRPGENCRAKQRDRLQCAPPPPSFSTHSCLLVQEVKCGIGSVQAHEDHWKEGATHPDCEDSGPPSHHSHKSQVLPSLSGSNDKQGPPPLNSLVSWFSCWKIE